ncbi:MAG: hypothetical protein DRO40_06135 [Thermoprotei archaeon]|nr:MAG: hypothetical protein DRO40_06135 [Thermoprotei archaeon]
MYAKVLKVVGVQGTSHYIVCKHFVAPAGEEIFAVLGEDRVLYVPIDSNVGKEYAVRIVKKTAWNIKKIKVGKVKTSAVYFIPKPFAKTLNIKKGDLVLVLGHDSSLEVIPIKVVVEKLGKFREPLLSS